MPFLKLPRLEYIILPPTCIVCGIRSDHQNRDLCKSCEQLLLATKSGKICIKCSRPVTIENSICGECLNHKRYFERIYALYPYSFPVPKIITDLKYNQHLENARVLSTLMIPQIELWYAKDNLPECIIPVPLHYQKLKQRGFNQAIVLAKPIAKYFRLPLVTNCCVRTKNTVSQTILPAKVRRKNIRRAFKITKPITAQHIAIFDDVVTTASTVNELSKILLQSGIARIDVWCVAKSTSRD